MQNIFRVGRKNTNGYYYYCYNYYLLLLFLLLCIIESLIVIDELSFPISLTHSLLVDNELSINQCLSPSISNNNLNTMHGLFSFRVQLDIRIQEFLKKKNTKRSIYFKMLVSPINISLLFECLFEHDIRPIKSTKSKKINVYTSKNIIRTDSCGKDIIKASVDNIIGLQRFLGIIIIIYFLVFYYYYY